MILRTYSVFLLFVTLLFVCCVHLSLCEKTESDTIKDEATKRVETSLDFHENHEYHENHNIDINSTTSISTINSIVFTSSLSPVTLATFATTTQGKYT